MGFRTSSHQGRVKIVGLLLLCLCIQKDCALTYFMKESAELAEVHNTHKILSPRQVMLALGLYAQQFDLSMQQVDYTVLYCSLDPLMLYIGSKIMGLLRVLLLTELSDLQ